MLITKLRFRSDKELPRTPLGQDVRPKSVTGLPSSQRSMYAKSLQQQIAGKYNWTTWISWQKHKGVKCRKCNMKRSRVRTMEIWYQALFGQPEHTQCQGVLTNPMRLYPKRSHDMIGPAYHITWYCRNCNGTSRKGKRLFPFSSRLLSRRWPPCTN